MRIDCIYIQNALLRSPPCYYVPVDVLFAISMIGCCCCCIKKDKNVIGKSAMSVYGWARNPVICYMCDSVFLS